MYGCNLHGERMSGAVWQSPWLALLFAVASWWLGTGVILWLVRRAQPTFGRSNLWLTALALASLVLAWHSMQAVGTAHAYLGFGAAMVMWAWHELMFLTGWLTGPRRQPQERHAAGWQRWRQGVAAVAWHEVALVLNFAVLMVLQQGLPNHTALCTFAVLWCMRFSAKINLFLGVPQVGAQFLPPHLVYLGSYFRSSPPSWFFYVSVGLAGATLAWLIWQAQAAAIEVTPGWTLLASLLGLAIVEHVLMVLAAPVQRLWGWAMGRTQPLAVAKAEGG